MSITNQSARFISFLFLFLLVPSWTATQDCVIDTIPPEVRLRAGISTFPAWVGPYIIAGKHTIPARIFDVGSSDNCTSSEDLIFSWSLNPADSIFCRYCSVIDPLVDTMIYVWDMDSLGNPLNVSMGRVMLHLESCIGNTTYSTEGHIKTEKGLGITNVKVEQIGTFQTVEFTNNEGEYSSLGYYQDSLTLIPSKDTFHRNGVSTFDLILIAKHITGNQLLPSPYKIIAADVNNDSRVTTFDLIELRKLILYNTDQFSNNSSWRFVPADYTFPQPLDPFSESFPESYTIQSLEQDYDDLDFVAIKVGDVNGSAQTDFREENPDADTGQLFFETKDIELEKGKTYEFVIEVKDVADILGYQFTLGAAEDALEFQSVIDQSILEKEGLYFGTKNSTITASCINEKSIDQQQIKLEVKAKQNGKLSEFLQLNSNHTKAEAYQEGGRLLSPILRFDSKEILEEVVQDCAQDTIPPVVVLRPGVVSIPLVYNADCTIELHARDNDVVSSDNCTDRADLIFSWSLDPTDTVKLLPAEPMYLPVDYSVYVWDRDENGNPNNVDSGMVSILLYGEYCEYILCMNDTIPPTPVLRTGISSIPSPGGPPCYVNLLARDYNIGSTDNCTPENLLRYSWSLDPNDTVKRIYSSWGPALLHYWVYVWDLDDQGNPNNVDSATITIHVYTDHCGHYTLYDVTGSLETELGTEITQVNVQVSGGVQEEQTFNGAYDYQLIADREYTVTPTKNDNFRNGVSTFDLVLIARHITGRQLLHTPYQLIAADVNRDGRITTFDLIELRKLILFINTEFPNNTSWRFVLADYQFSDPDNPFADPFPESHFIQHLNRDIEANFIGIKVGDVNGSARP